MGLIRFLCVVGPPDRDTEKSEIIYRNIDDAFPLYIPGWEGKASSSIEGIESVKANLNADYTTKIQGLIFSLDEFNNGIMIDFRGRVSKTALFGPNSLTGFWIQDVKAVSLMPGGPALSGK